MASTPSAARAARRRADVSRSLRAHQPRLRAVVQVALQAPALGVTRLHDPRARRAQLREARAQLGVEQREVGAQQAGEEGEGHQARRDEGGPPRRVADAGPGHRHEQEGQQRRRCRPA
jgi:hypothetical protein